MRSTRPEQNECGFCQFFPLAAGKALGYPQCVALTGHGNIGLLYKCKPENHSFAVVPSTCGFQPITINNRTIAKDGYRLIPSRPCLWKDSLVNFGGTVHTVRNGKWEPLHSSFSARRVHYKRHFNASIDNSSEYLHSALTGDPAGVFHLVEELGGLLEHSDHSSIDSYLQHKTEYGPEHRLSKKIGSLHIFLFGTSAIGVIFLFALCGYLSKFRICKWVYRTALDFFRLQRPVADAEPLPLYDRAHRGTHYIRRLNTEELREALEDAALELNSLQVEPSDTEEDRRDEAL